MAIELGLDYCLECFHCMPLRRGGVRGGPHLVALPWGRQASAQPERLVKTGYKFIDLGGFTCSRRVYLQFSRF